MTPGSRQDRKKGMKERRSEGGKEGGREEQVILSSKTFIHISTFWLNNFQIIAQTETTNNGYLLCIVFKNLSYSKIKLKR